MYITDDPVADALRYEAEQEKALKRLPKCCECGEPIQSDECYEFDGDFICPDCLKNNHRKWVEDIVS